MKKYESRSLEVKNILSIHGGLHIIAREEYWNKSFFLFGTTKDEMQIIYDNLKNSFLHGIKFEVGRLFDDGDKASFKLKVMGHNDWKYDHYSSFIKNE